MVLKREMKWFSIEFCQRVELIPYSVWHLSHKRNRSRFCMYVKAYVDTNDNVEDGTMRSYGTYRLFLIVSFVRGHTASPDVQAIVGRKPSWTIYQADRHFITTELEKIVEKLHYSRSSSVMGLVLRFRNQTHFELAGLCQVAVSVFFSSRSPRHIWELRTWLGSIEELNFCFGGSLEWKNLCIGLRCMPFTAGCYQGPWKWSLFLYLLWEGRGMQSMLRLGASFQPSFTSRTIWCLWKTVSLLLHSFHTCYAPSPTIVKAPSDWSCRKGLP